MMQSEHDITHEPLPVDSWQRLHPSSLFFGALSRLGAFIIPLVLLVFFRAGDTWEVWIGAFILAGIVFEVYAYFTTRYRFDDRELIVERRLGLIFHNTERHVPFSRIQNIDLTQNPLHRMFKVATVRVETAGGSEPEAVLKVLSLDAVEEMRRRVFAPRRSPAQSAEDASFTDAAAVSSATADDEQPQHLLLALSAPELVRLGLTSVRGLAVVAVFFTVAWQLDMLDPLAARAQEWLDALQKVGGLGVWTYAAATTGALILFMMLSVAWAIWKFHGFQLVRIGDDLRLTCGLFTRISATVPRNRVQLICIRETFAHRWMKRASVRIETASGGGSEEGEQARFSQKWIVPIIRTEQLPELLRQISDHAVISDLEWKPLAPRARRRRVIRAIRFAVLGCALAAIGLKFWALALFAAWLPLAIWHAIAAVRITGYARTGWGIVFRSGVLFRSTSMTMFSKMQVISAMRSPFDRRWGMARLRVDTAGAGPAEHTIDIGYLDAGVVEDLRRDLVVTAERARWRI